MKKLAFFHFTLMLSSISYSQQTQLIKFSEKKQEYDYYGVKNSEGKVILPAKFLGLGIYDNYIIAGDAKNSMYYDNKGKLLATYCDIKEFRYGVSIVRDCKTKDGFKGLINKQGKVVLPPNKYTEIEDFTSYGLSLVSTNAYEKFGLIDTLGKTIAPCKYDAINLTAGVGDGLVPFQLDDKWGFMNIKGQEVIKAIYEDADFFRNGKAKVSEMDKLTSKTRTFFIDTKGKEVN